MIIRDRSLSVKELIVRQMKTEDARDYIKRMEGESVDQMADRSVIDSAIAWDELIEDRGDPKEIEDMLALELEFCAMGYAPPHFDKVTTCDRCGPVLSPYRDQLVLHCHWCGSGYTDKTNKLLKSQRDCVES